MVYSQRGMFLRLIYLVTALLCLIFSKIKRIQKSGYLILCYHGVEDMQRKSFADQVKRVSNRTVSTSNLDNPGGLHANELLICLTFDDSFVNLLSNVIPTVTELEIPITIFVPTGCLGTCPIWLSMTDHSDSNETILSVNQLSSLSKNPLVSFGSHTVNHPRLSTLNATEIREELLLSKKYIEKIVNHTVSELALPHGDYTVEVLNIAFELGYTKVYTLDPKIHSYVVNHQQQTIGRFSMSPDVWPIEFYLTVNGAYTWLFPWRAFIQKMKNCVYPQKDICE